MIAGHIGDNYQFQWVYVIKSAEARAKLSTVTRKTYGAPVVLMVCYDKDKSWKNTPQTFGRTTMAERWTSAASEHR